MKLSHSLFIIIIFVGGLLGAYSLGKHNTEAQFDEFYYSDQAALLASRVHALSILRQGQHEKAFEYLESLVDGSLIAMATYKEVALRENDTDFLSSLKCAALYREIHKRRPKVFEKTISESLEFGEKYGELTKDDYIDKYLNPNKALQQSPKSGAAEL